jgi:subtilisin family serine protease
VAPLVLVKLPRLMALSSGTRNVSVALLDGPVAADHPDLAGASIRGVGEDPGYACRRSDSAACAHGTFVAGILAARRESRAPAICPGCTLLLRPIFAETSGNGQVPSATPDELARATLEAIEAGARVINISGALSQLAPNREPALEDALDHAARRGVITVVAAGNQGAVGGSALVRHPSVVPVVACDRRGAPMRQSNLGSSIGRRGLRAPGEIVSLGTGGTSVSLAGTSAAAPLVTGAIALLWSEFPAATAAQVVAAVTSTAGSRRRTVVPPLLDAWAAYGALAAVHERG